MIGGSDRIHVRFALRQMGLLPDVVHEQMISDEVIHRHDQKSLDLGDGVGIMLLVVVRSGRRLQLPDAFPELRELHGFGEDALLQRNVPAIVVERLSEFGVLEEAGHDLDEILSMEIVEKEC